MKKRIPFFFLDWKPVPATGDEILETFAAASRAPSQRLPAALRLIVPPRSGLPSAMAMQPPKPKLGVDPARSRDIMDDMVNAVRPDARSFTAARLPAASPPV